MITSPSKRSVGQTNSVWYRTSLCFVIRATRSHSECQLTGDEVKGSRYEKVN